MCNGQRKWDITHDILIFLPATVKVESSGAFVLNRAGGATQRDTGAISDLFISGPQNEGSSLVTGNIMP